MYYNSVSIPWGAVILTGYSAEEIDKAYKDPKFFMFKKGVDRV